MRFIALIISGLLFFVTCVTGQSEADHAARNRLAGTWILNSKKSTGRELSDRTTWTISNAGSEIRIRMDYVLDKDEAVHTVLLHADERGETNIKPIGPTRKNEIIVSKTRWDKNTLVRRYRTTSDPAVFTFDITEKYILSKDGRRLTVQSRNRSNYPDLAGSLPVTLVFDRNSDKK